MTTQQPEALRLAELFTADEWPGHMTLISYARECVAELRRQHASIAELEAQLSAIAHTAEGATAQTETLRAELADETEAADNWRRLLPIWY